MILNLDSVDCACLGGAFLGGGGGGSMAEGKKIGEAAVRSGPPVLVPLSDLSDDAAVLTVSAVGAPAASGARVEPDDYVRCIRILRANGVRVDGLITSENGGLATVNGWYQSACLGIPLVDAACNGRAHPMGSMGSMGLHKVDGFCALQAASGGDPAASRHLELFVSGSLDQAAKMIRECAVAAGGMVAVARNAVPAAYLRAHAAVGAISQAMEIGRLLRGALSGRAAARAVFDCLGGGEILAEGEVHDLTLETVGGFDVGAFRVLRGADEIALSFCNEYICAEREKERLATFPDLIATLDPESGSPVSTAEVRNRMPLLVLCVPRNRMKLGSGMKDPELFRRLEQIVHRQIVQYL